MRVYHLRCAKNSIISPPPLQVGPMSEEEHRNCEHLQRNREKAATAICALMSIPHKLRRDAIVVLRVDGVDRK
jgi:hypothetical protein